MAIYEGDAYFVFEDGHYLTVEADDIDDAEQKMIEIIEDEFPTAKNITIENMKELKVK